MLYSTETEFPHSDWTWSGINDEVAYPHPDDFWDEMPILYDINGEAYIYEFRPLIELKPVYGVRKLDENLETYMTKYFYDWNDAKAFAEDIE